MTDGPHLIGNGSSPPVQPIRGSSKPSNALDPSQPLKPTLPGHSAYHPERLFLCRFLGRLHDVAIHVRRRQASEKRQGTKSRLVGSGGWSTLYGDLATAGVAGMVHWGNRIGWQRRAAGR